MSSVYVNLGRAGDIISFLPVLHHEYRTTGVKPRLVVAKAYADILDGVSYVDPIIFNGDFADVNGGISLAKTISNDVKKSQVIGIPNVIASQVYGSNHHPKIVCDSFQKDAWKLAGNLNLWPFQPPLIFDRRNLKREKKLFKGIPTAAPWIVISTGGVSSPFPWDNLFREIVYHCFPHHRIIDLADFKAERFYDLLGIMDHPNTEALMLTDSGNLHLAYASSKPIHAFVTDTPTMWHGAAYRNTYASYTRYKNFPRDITRIIDLIRVPPLKPKHPNIIHVYQRTPWSTGAEKKRNELAKKSWDRIGWVDCGLDDNCFVRHAGNVVPKETKNIPMIKDMLRMGCMGRNDSDIIVLTNTDTCVSYDIAEKLKQGLPAFCFRYDFDKLDELIPDDQIKNGKWYAGSDLFAFTVGWWRKNNSLFPDMILGREAWDKIMRELIQRNGGREIYFSIYHQRHDSYWENASNINSDPSNLRNRMLARNWLKERNIPLAELEHSNYEGKI